MSTSIFTHLSDSDGKLSVGVLPDELKQLTYSLGDMFYSTIPPSNKKNITYHIWNHEFPKDIYNIVKQVKEHKIWKRLCSYNESMINISDMDELYYSRTPIEKKRGLLYGATTNYDLHIDGMFKFPGVRLYRILIGLTDGNKEIETYFPTFKVSKYINKNDFIAFDFDRAKHRVINHSTQESDKYRILLKLHYCVYPTSSNPIYIRSISTVYRIYEIITRYIMRTGTDPKTYYQFFLGLLAIITAKIPYVLYLYGFLLVIYILLLFINHDYSIIIGNILLGIILIYMLVVFLFWMRFKITGRK